MAQHEKKDADAACQVEPFYDAVTGSLTYLIRAAGQRDCIVIDAVLDLDLAAGRVHTTSLSALCERLDTLELYPAVVLETHVHADHLSGAAWLRERYPGVRTGIGAGVDAMQSHFGAVYNRPLEVSAFDLRLADGERVRVGALEVETLATPGHTPACVSYRVGNYVFVGDTLFMPDAGSARADFPGADPRELYRSIRRLLSLPEDTLVCVAHDYCPGGRDMGWQATVAEHRARNKHVRDGIDEAAFVEMRRTRDATLNTPALMLAAIPVNLCGGELPRPEDNGRRYLRIPLEPDTEIP